MRTHRTGGAATGLDQWRGPGHELAALYDTLLTHITEEN